MTSRRFTGIAAAVLICLAAISTPPTSGEGRSVRPIRAEKSDACPVCGMSVAPYPEWLARVELGGGQRLLFDGPRDLFTWLLLPERFRRDPDAEIASVSVTTYYEGETLPAEEAFFVLGSDVRGPMGPELVPHRTLDDAEEFVRDHGGERIVRFADITPRLLGLRR